jgi:CRP/FNR family transcriptional regulator
LGGFAFLNRRHYGWRSAYIDTLQVAMRRQVLDPVANSVGRVEVRVPVRLTPPTEGSSFFAPELLPRVHFPRWQTTIWHPLAPRPLAAFFDGGTRQSWAKDEVLHRGGDARGAVYKVNAGIVAVSKVLSSGERQIVRLLLPGDVCGDLAEDGIGSFDGVALNSEVRTCGLTRAHFDSLVAQNAAMAIAVRVELAAALSEVSLQMTAIGTLPATARVANFLCDMRAAFDARGMQAFPLRLPMTRTDIGDYLGLRVETVSRAFTKLRQLRLIKLVDAETVVIINPAAFAAVALRVQ